MQYLISVIDDGQAQVADSDESASSAEMTATDLFNEQLQLEGHWVFAGGLGRPLAATVIDNRGEVPMISDGPFLESKEFLAGFWIIEAADLDVALRIARDASKACNRKLEVRPFLQG
ncbi:YciI family protein [Brevibacterium aurantiacum]|uniref:YCII-related domain-containing protein n=1 Tax=Brevibacterium aurantiacum TaxID=273384 RepID=A0A2A3ZRP4_BREAU|nr:YciI family protein [Brevibacterium aurantiacum]PCC54161.1 hypothetical protein CIK59_07230 [Brevibacterium aurantiacum]